MSNPSSIWLAFGISLGALGGAAAISLDGLTSNSPFVPHSAAGTMPAHPETSAIEFRGVISSQDGTVFGLYDRTRNQGAWVRQNETGADITVLDYDAARTVVTVDYQGQKISLALSSAKIESAAASPLPVIAGAPLAAPVSAAAVSAGPLDQRKLESIAAEVRRRRALRVAAPAVTPAQP